MPLVKFWDRNRDTDYLRLFRLLGAESERGTKWPARRELKVSF